MAEPRGISEAVAKLSAEHPNTRKEGMGRNGKAVDGHTRTSELDKQRHDARRVEAMNLRLAGFSYETIAERLGITEGAVQSLITRTLDKAVNLEVDQLREVENARLDRAQAAIWSKVLQGDEKSIETFLRISQRRAKLNGLDAPQKIQMAVSVKQEMEQALGELRQVVLGSAIEDAEIVGDSDESDVDPL